MRTQGLKDAMDNQPTHRPLDPSPDRGAASPPSNSPPSPRSSPSWPSSCSPSSANASTSPASSPPRTTCAPSRSPRSSPAPIPATSSASPTSNCPASTRGRSADAFDNNRSPAQRPDRPAPPLLLEPPHSQLPALTATETSFDLSPSPSSPCGAVPTPASAPPSSASSRTSSGPPHHVPLHRYRARPRRRT
jgi:hypothetical protein